MQLVTVSGLVVTDAPEMVQLPPLVTKLLPVMATLAPTRAGLAAVPPGVSVIVGTIVRVGKGVGLESPKFPATAIPATRPGPP
jgi:hypothetical protein